MTARRLFAILALAPLLAGAAFAGKTSSQRPIKIGLLADCGGAFGGWYQISLAGGAFDLFYYDAMAATLDALAAVHGDLSADEKPFMAALAHVDLNAPNGRFTPDPHRQAVGPNLVLALQWPKIAFRVLRTIPIVEPSFGGYFTAHDPPPGEQTPKCVKRTPPPWATTR